MEVGYNYDPTYIDNLRRLTMTKMLDYAIDSGTFREILRDALANSLKEKMPYLSADNFEVFSSGIDKGELHSTVYDAVEKSLKKSLPFEEGEFDLFSGLIEKKVEGITDEFKKELVKHKKFILEHSKADNDQKQRILEALSSVVDNTAAKIGELKAVDEDTKKQIQESLDDLPLLKKGIGSVLIRLNELKNSNKLSQEDFDRLQNIMKDVDLENNQALIDKLSSKLDFSNENLDINIGEIKEGIGTLVAKLDALSEANEIASETTREIIKEIKAVEPQDKREIFETLASKMMGAADSQLNEQLEVIKKGVGSLFVKVNEIKTATPETPGYEDMEKDVDLLKKGIATLLSRFEELKEKTLSQEDVKKISQKFAEADDEGKEGLIESLSSKIGGTTGMLNEVIRVVKKQLEALSEKVEGLGDARELIKESTDKINAEVAAVRESVNLVFAKLDELSTAKRISSPDNTVRLEKGMLELATFSRQVADKIDSLKKNITALEKTTPAKDAQVSIKELGKLESVFTSVSDRLSDIIQKNKVLKRELEKTQRENIFALKELSVDQKKGIKDLLSRHEELSKRLGSMEGVLEKGVSFDDSEIKKGIASIKRKTSRLGFTISKLKEVSENVYMLNNRIQDAYSSHNSRLDKLGDQVVKAHKQVYQIPLVLDRVKDISKNSYALSKDLDRLETKLRHMEDQIGVVSRKIDRVLKKK